MAAYSSILAWRMSWTEEPGGLQAMGSQGLDATERLNHHHQVCVCAVELTTLEQKEILRDDRQFPYLIQQQRYTRVKTHPTEYLK